MAQPLKADTASQVVRIGPAVSVSDGFTAVTTLALTTADEAVVIKNDGTVVDISGGTWTFAAVTGADSMYDLTIKNTDVSLEGALEVVITDVSLCLPIVNRFEVLSEAAYDSKYAVNTGNFMKVNTMEWLSGTIATPTVAGVPEVDPTYWRGGAIPAVTVTGVPEVDLTHMGGVAQSAADLKDFADDGYNPATNKVTGVLLVDTTTTSTNAETAIGNLNDFDPTSDDVAIVTALSTGALDDAIQDDNVQYALARMYTAIGALADANILAGSFTGSLTIHGYESKYSGSAVLLGTLTSGGAFTPNGAATDDYEWVYVSGYTSPSNLVIEIVDGNGGTMTVNIQDTPAGAVILGDGSVNDSSLTSNQTTNDGRVGVSRGSDGRFLITTDAQALPNLDVAIGVGGIPVGAFAANSITDASLASDAEVAIATAVGAEVIETNGSITRKEAESLVLAVIAGVTNTGGVVFKDPSGTTTRVTVVVNASNERTSSTLVPSA